MNRLPKSIACLAPLALGLAACSGAEEAPAAPPLEGAAIGGDFTLTGEDGEPVSWDDFDGKYRTLYFGYTFCPDVCPVDTGRAMAGLKQFEAASPDRGEKVQPLFISVDPQRDTPEVLTEFTDQFHPRLIGMTGTKEQLDKVVDDFKSYYRIGEPGAGGGYLVDHTSVTYLFGPDGQPIATLPTDEGADAVAAELDKWVN
ncbi:SCO family protein [Alteriqipengyuania sp.]|uniref:SCO family protein n=1 Tax=Alteriqipengyuania sp. TaxID=2800692 RepID=UPI003512749D